MRLRFIRDESGFTLQEVMVVLIVGSILVAFSFELFLFANRLFFNWEHTSEYHTKVAGAYQRVSLDIQHAKRIEHLSDTSLVLIRHDGRRIDYRYGGGSVSRNDMVLIDEGATLSIRLEGEEGRIAREVIPVRVKLQAAKGSKVLEFSGVSAFELSGREKFIKSRPRP